MSTSEQPARLVTGAFQGLPPGLTPAQVDAVMAEDPVLCVLAGAGAGKTGVLTLRVARRALDGTATPQRTLVCTFSRKAADELRTRLWRLGIAGVTAGTIHRVALRVLRDWRERAAAPAPSVLGDRRRLIETLDDIGSAPQLAATAEAEVGWAKARMIAPADYPSAVQESHRLVRLPVALTTDVYAAYEAERVRRGLLDLDDLLLEAAQVMRTEPEFAEAIRWRHRHLFVDETQDVNPAQFQLLRSLVPEEPDLFVVGDPAQSVYGWNGADPSLLDDLPGIFPEARVIRLDENHRSTPAIVAVAGATLGASAPATATRSEGTLPVLATHDDDDAEARWVAHQAWLARGPGRRWSHIAVLARTNAQLDIVAKALGAQRIPFQLAGRDLGPASDLAAAGRDGLVEDAGEEVPSESDGADGIVLSTIHRAKGLQWPCVFVIGLSEGLMPLYSARTEGALAEERRLLYVAMTRAEDELWCSWARGNDPGRDGRNRCRWLAEAERTRERLAVEQAPATGDALSAHMARLKALVS